MEKLDHHPLLLLVTLRQVLHKWDRYVIVILLFDIMKAIFKIIKYNPERQQIVVRFARLRAPESIDKYKVGGAIDLSQLDCYDSESFVKSLMRKFGNDLVKQQEDKEPIINEAETIPEKLNFEELVGKTIECKVDESHRAILKMRRVVLWIPQSKDL